MKKGGYKIIDMGEKVFSPFVAQKVNGAYDAIHENNRFSVLLSGIVYGGKVLADTMVNFTETDDGYKAIILLDGGMLCITIDEYDIVTVKPMQRTDAEAATTLAAGLIKQIEHQPNATPATEDEEKTAPTVAEYNALVEKYNDLLGAMVEAEIMAEASPEPTLQPLEIGDNISGGQQIYVKKVDNIDDLIGALPNATTIISCDGGYPNISITRTDAGPTSSFLRQMKYNYNGIGGGVVIYSHSGDNDPVWGAENDYLTLTGSVTGTISAIYPDNGINGVVIGKMA